MALIRDRFDVALVAVTSRLADTIGRRPDLASKATEMDIEAGSDPTFKANEGHRNGY